MTRSTYQERYPEHAERLERLEKVREAELRVIGASVALREAESTYAVALLQQSTEVSTATLKALHHAEERFRNDWREAVGALLATRQREGA